MHALDIELTSRCLIFKFLNFLLLLYKNGYYHHIIINVMPYTISNSMLVNILGVDQRLNLRLTLA
jgi:hypothetical protein